MQGFKVTTVKSVEVFYTFGVTGVQYTKVLQALNPEP